jgi:hypothetical protein
MPERRLPTLADAQRQVRWRAGIGWLLVGLVMIFLLLFLLKGLYQTPASPFLPWQPALRRFIDSILDDWVVLALLWRAIPPWQSRPTLPTAPLWDHFYVVCGASAVMCVAGFLLRSAYARRAQITEFRQEMQREAWRQQARAAQGLAPGYRGPMTVIDASWHQYAAPPESWSHTTLGSVILGLIIALVSGIILLYAEYLYFQMRWPSSRN